MCLAMYVDKMSEFVGALVVIKIAEMMHAFQVKMNENGKIITHFI